MAALEFNWSSSRDYHRVDVHKLLYFWRAQNIMTSNEMMEINSQAKWSKKGNRITIDFDGGIVWRILRTLRSDKTIALTMKDTTIYR